MGKRQRDVVIFSSAACCVLAYLRHYSSSSVPLEFLQDKARDNVEDDNDGVGGGDDGVDE